MWNLQTKYLLFYSNSNFCFRNSTVEKTEEITDELWFRLNFAFWSVEELNNIDDLELYKV